ncbi:MAG: LytTR family DNA-binding domain-containing protein [Lachnospiraceae bacterium]|nr:LytTR family DNA-binding domain-containing protein [Lachnospiraceae bacterium]
MLRIAICDDEPAERRLLSGIISKTDIDSKIDEYSSASDFLKVYKAGEYDIIFMDIYMIGCSGVEAVSKIREFDDDVFIAFTTSSLDHALDGYRLHVQHYIEKPVNPKQVLDALSAAKESIASKEEKDQASDSICNKNLVYAEQYGHSQQRHYDDGSVSESLCSLDALLNELGENPYYRCHKSFLINMDFVESLDKAMHCFITTTGDNVYISRSNEPLMNKLYKERLDK